MSNLPHCGENQAPKPGGHGGSVHGETPLVRSKSELTPEQYKRQRTNLIFAVLLVVLILVGFFAFQYFKEALFGAAALPAPAAAFLPLLA